MGSGQGQEESTNPWGLLHNRGEIFDDPNHVVGENYFMEETGEQRSQMIGMTRNLALLLVVFVEPGSDVIRIISARKAVDYEESIYNGQFH